MKRGQYNPKEHAAALYNMHLHETLEFTEELFATRVPGGWLYFEHMSTTFVPFNGEFKEEDKPITAKDIPECNEITNCRRDY